MTDETIRKHKLVEFTYRILDEHGRVLEQVDLPFNYIHGRDSGMHEKIERAMEGHRAGDTVTVRLDPSDGFGEADPNLIFTDDIDNVPEEFRRVGAEVEFRNDRGETKTFRVTEREDGKLTFDGNHPLAGKPIEFNLEILQVRDATADELSGLVPTGQAVGLSPSTSRTIN
ncbi:MAG: peptidylprolyl isomerase [Thiotrichales bacterium]